MSNAILALFFGTCRRPASRITAWKNAKLLLPNILIPIIFIFYYTSSLHVCSRLYIERGGFSIKHSWITTQKPLLARSKLYNLSHSSRMKSSYSSLVTGLAFLLVTCSAAPYAAPISNELDFIGSNGLIKEPRQVEERAISLGKWLYFYKLINNLTLWIVCLTNPIYIIFKLP